MNYPSLSDDFHRADGLPGVAVSGHAWSPSGNPLPAIVSSQLTAAGPGTGAYTFADVFLHPEYQYVDVKWTNSAGFVVLHSTSRSGNDLTQMSHSWFGPIGYIAQVRENGGTIDTLKTADYAIPAVLGTTYRIGVSYDGPCLTLTLPDGTKVTACSDRYERVTGRYLCFQPNDTAFVSTAGCLLQGRRLVN